MRTKLVVLILVFCLGGAVYGQAWKGEFSAEWSNGDNWWGGLEPTRDSGEVGIRPGMVYDPVITEPNEVVGGRCYFSRDGHLTVESGDLTCWDRVYLGYARNGAGTLTVKGGTVSIPTTRLSVADESPGTVNMYGGVLNIGYPSGGHIAWPDGSGPGVINLYGGVMLTGIVGWKDREGCIMIFHSGPGYPHGGKLIIKGDWTQPQECDNICNSMLEKYRLGGIITNVPGDVVNIEYDADEDATTVESISSELLAKPCQLYSDDIIDSADLGVFSANWLWSGPPGGHNAGDFNGDGYVNLVDYATLAGQWHEPCD